MTTAEYIQTILDNGAKLMGQLAGQIGATAQHLYAVVVRQQFAEGLATILSWSLIGWLGYWGLSKTWKTVQSGIAKKKNESETYVLAGAIISIAIVIAVINIVPIFIGALLKIINPEFYAVKLIFDAAKQLK